MGRCSSWMKGGSPRSRRLLPFALGALLVSALGACSDSSTHPDVFDGTLEDGGQAGRWATASPVSQGLDPEVLLELADEIDTGTWGRITSLLVVRNGRLVFERYWHDQTADRLHVVNSVTKSVTSLLVGIARADGDLPPLDTPILDLLPPLPSLAHPEGKDAITLEHVLTMRTGLEWDERSNDYSSTLNPVFALAASPDWPAFTMGLPLASAPGSRFAYNSGVSVLLSSALQHALGVTAAAFADVRLFSPLGITNWSWSTTNGGLSNGGWGLALTPRDMAAIGQLVLNDGSWDGVSLVPPAWLHDSAEAATRFVSGGGYGYQWWLDEDDGRERAVSAWGYGGQFIVIIPSLDAVVVSTAENFLGGGYDPYILADYLDRATGTPRSSQ